jgi:hypothetical protein
MNKKKILILIVIVAVITIVVIFTKNRNRPETIIENEVAKNNVEINKVTFSDITKKYENGITTLSAKMTNNTNKTKKFTVQIVLRDDNGKEVQKLTQVVENLEKDKTKILSTGIVGDYTNIKDIRFELIND